MIVAKDLTRHYGTLTAVNDVNFTVGDGEIVGLLGHNGAGKTTIMKMLTGFLEPSSGSVSIDGYDVETQRSDRRRAGHGSCRGRQGSVVGCGLLCGASCPGEGRLVSDHRCRRRDQRGRRLWLVLLMAAVLALSLGGLPLTGGALAKFAIKESLGNSIASTAATVSAAGTTLLMLHFLLRLQRSRDARAAASAGLVWSWLAVALASIVVPWLMYPALGGDIADALTPAAILEALWPVLSGALVAPGFWLWGNRLPRIAEGDIVVKEEAAFHASYAFGAALERVDARLRQWPAAGLSLLAVALVLAVAAASSH
jgi:energy-coupling factor transporter ATP-binding protein EcfA2